MAVRQTRRAQVNNRPVRRSAYVDGTAARQLDVVEEIRKPAKKVTEQDYHVRRNRDKAAYMNLGYTVFLTVALLFVGSALMSYINLRSSITLSVKHIAALESQLNDLKLANDEELNRVENSVDLDRVRMIALTELGMTYPTEDQIVIVPDEGADYVRQVSSLTE